jgi:hypothetical protein
MQRIAEFEQHAEEELARLREDLRVAEGLARMREHAQLMQEILRLNEEIHRLERRNDQIAGIYEARIELIYQNILRLLAEQGDKIRISPEETGR